MLNLCCQSCGHVDSRSGGHNLLQRLRALHSYTTSKVSVAWLISVAPACSPLTDDAKNGGVSSAAIEAEYAERVMRLLYLTEFAVLTEFISFVVPLIYGALLALLLRFSLSREPVGC